MFIGSMLRRLVGFRFTVPNTLMIVGGMALVGLVAVGVTALAKGLGQAGAPGEVRQGTVVSGQKSAKRSEAVKISEAKFGYLVPPDSSEWHSDPVGEVYDVTTGVVKYEVQKEGSAATITVSQQEFPKQLESREAAKFKEFTKQYKVVTDQAAGKGTAYFMPALENGQPSNGTDTAIFATDEVLMFARSNQIMSYGDWVKILGTMKRR